VPGASDVVLVVDLAKRRGGGGAVGSGAKRRDGGGTVGGGVELRVVSKGDLVRRDLIPPPPTTRLTPVKQSTTNSTESVTVMVPRCPALGTKYR